MCFRAPRSALAAWTTALVLALAGGPARAQTLFQADGVADVGYTTTALTPSNNRSLYAEVGPAVTLQGGSPELKWRAGYQFLGGATLSGAQADSYANQLSLSLARQFSPDSALTASAGVVQGNNAFQLTQRAPQAGQPQFLAPGNPDLITATLAESFVWDPSPHLRMSQDFLASASAPQNAPGQSSSTLGASLRLERLLPRDAIGAAFAPGFTVLRPLLGGGPPVTIATPTLLGSWNHDFDWRWNGEAAGGVEQVVVIGPGHPTIYVPTGSLTVRYKGDRSVLSLEVTRAAAANLQAGTESLNSAATLHGSLVLDRFQVGASVGFLRAQPLGQAIPSDASEIGNVVEADAGVVWFLSNALLVTARYSVSYQMGQAGGISPSLMHVVLVGFTVRYSNAPLLPPLPSMGRRVDGGDAVPFSSGDAGKR